MLTALVYTRGSERSSHLPEVIQPRVREPGQFEDSVEDGVRQKPRRNKETRAARGCGDLGWPSGSAWGGEERGGEGWERLEGSLEAVLTPEHRPCLGCLPSMLLFLMSTQGQTAPQGLTHPLEELPPLRNRACGKSPTPARAADTPAAPPSTAGLYDLLDLDTVPTMSVKLAPTTADMNSPGRGGHRIGSQFPHL